MSQESSFTPLSQLGEFGLIEHLTKSHTTKQNSSILGIGDDAAILQAPDGQQMVLSTDLLVEGVHFDLSYVPLKHLGYKMVAVNCSDICAMNATPSQITVSLALSSRFTVEALEELYAGIYLACEQYGVDLVGGDTSASQKGMVLSVTAVGFGTPETLVSRAGAKPTDLVVLSGDVGGAYLGLQLLEREKSVFQENPNMQPELQSSHSYALERQLKPEARVDTVKQLKELGIVPTSMIDVSDGLSSELFHICTASKVGVQIYEDKIPMDPSVLLLCDEFELHPMTPALHGGEDYELLFTLPLSAYEAIKEIPHMHVIGHISEEKDGKHLVNAQNQQIPLTSQGWNHSKK